MPGQMKLLKRARVCVLPQALDRVDLASGSTQWKRLEANIQRTKLTRSGKERRRIEVGCGRSG